MCNIDSLPYFIVEHIANDARNDSCTVGILKLFVTGAVDPFKTLDRRTHPNAAAERGHIDIVKWLFPLLTEKDENYTRMHMFHTHWTHVSQLWTVITILMILTVIF